MKKPAQKKEDKPFVIETPPGAVFSVGQTIYSCEEGISRHADELVTAWTVLYICAHANNRENDVYTLVRQRDGVIRDHTWSSAYRATRREALHCAHVSAELACKRHQEWLDTARSTLAAIVAALREEAAPASAEASS